MEMTLDEAIKHAEEVHDSDTSPYCSLEHRQLATWLRELKEYRNREIKATINARNEFTGIIEEHLEPLIVLTEGGNRVSIIIEKK